MIRILIADDHVRFRGVVRSLIDHQPDMTVVAVAGDAAAALVAVEQEAPDVVILDMRMPGLGSIEATRAMLAGRAAPAVLALSDFDDPALVAALVAAGGRGYLLKGDPPALLLQAIRELAAGGRRFSPSLGIPEPESQHSADSPRRPSTANVASRAAARRKSETRR